MKLFKPTVTFLLASIVLCSCSTDEIVSEVPDTDDSNITSNLSVTEAAILKSIKRNHPQIRSNTLEMIPYTLYGDVVFYVVNYDEGWEIFSNDLHLPMMIMKSETGNFNPADISKDDAPFMDFMKHTASTIHDVMEGKVEIQDEPDATWMPYLESASTTADMAWQEFNKQGYENPVIEVFEPLDGRLNTCWDQSSFFNVFTKHIYNTENGRYEMAPVGCNAVAVGQYLYWYHNHFNLPESFPEGATRHEDSGVYSYKFYGESNDWDMIYSDSDPLNLYELQTSLFLGDIAYRLGTTFGLKGSPAKKDSVVNVINSKLNYSNKHAIKSGTISNVCECLRNGYPMVGFCNTKNKNRKIGAHTFVLDYCKTEFHKGYKFWVYKEISDGNETEEDPFWDDESVTLEQLIEYYGKENVRMETYTYNYYWVKMNWGWNRKDNDCMINFSYLKNDYTYVSDEYTANGLEIITPDSYK